MAPNIVRITRQTEENGVENLDNDSADTGENVAVVSQDESADNDDGGATLIIIICIALILLALVVAVIFCVVICRRRRRRQKLQAGDTADGRSLIANIARNMNDEEKKKLLPLAEMMPKLELVIINNYRLQQVSKPFDQGHYGQVCKAHYQIREGQHLLVAVKEINQTIVEEDKKYIIQEASKLAMLCHKNILRLRGISFDISSEQLRLKLITDFLAHEQHENTLLAFLRNQKNHEDEDLINDAKIIQWITQVTDAMRFLHQNDVLHLDLAARNVLLDFNQNVRLTDYGLVQLLGLEQNVEFNRDPEYFPFEVMPPEILDPSNKDVIFTPKTDVWSFGLLLYEVCSFSKRPFVNVLADVPVEQRTQTLYKYLSDKNLPEPPPSMQKQLINLYNRCLQMDQDDRPSFDFLYKELQFAMDPENRKNFLLLPTVIERFA